MNKRKESSSKEAARKARDDRLAAALRENLRKRKEQGRARAPDRQGRDSSKDFGGPEK